MPCIYFTYLFGGANGSGTAAQPAAPQATAAAAPSPKPSHGATIEAHDWLTTLNPQAYLVQIMATPKRPLLDNFLAKHPVNLEQRTSIVRTQSRGSDWYVLLVGPYQDRSAANAAVEQLPAVFKKNEPWVRKVSAVQQKAR